MGRKVSENLRDRRRTELFSCWSGRMPDKASTMPKGGQLVHLHVIIPYKWYLQRLYHQASHSVNKLSNSRSFLRRRKRINKTKADPGHFDREIENKFRPSYSALPCSRASDCGIRWCEVRFLMGTPNVFFVPRSWQDEKHLFLFPYRAQNLPSLIFYLQIMIMYWKAINTIGI